MRRLTSFRFASAFDPLRLVALHRRWLFRMGAECESGLRTTYRSSLLVHDAKPNQVKIGRNACVDGTIEVYAKASLSIGSNFFLGRSRIYCAHRMQIGNFVLVSDGVCIMDSDLHPKRASSRRAVANAWAAGTFPDVYSETAAAAVQLDDDVWIGYGASVLKGVTIGQGAIVGAGAVVRQSVPAWSVVAGSPARVVAEIGPDER